MQMGKLELREVSDLCRGSRSWKGTLVCFGSPNFNQWHLCSTDSCESEGFIPLFSFASVLPGALYLWSKVRTQFALQKWFLTLVSELPHGLAGIQGLWCHLRPWISHLACFKHQMGPNSQPGTDPSSQTYKEQAAGERREQIGFMGSTW